MPLPLWTAAGQRALYDLLGYRTGHPEQDRLLYDWAHRYHVVACPARASKSYTAAKKALPVVLGRTRHGDGDRPVPTRTWVVGPTYELAEKEFRYLWEDLAVEGPKRGLWEKPTKARLNRASGDLVFMTPWGSVVAAKSADKPQSLLGEAVDCLIMAEAAQFHSPDVWTRYLQPRLATTQGYAIFPTTPDAGASWLHELWVKGLEGADGLLTAYTWPVSGNPVYPLEEFEIQKAFYGEAHPVFREQYLGEWVFHHGTVFGRDFDPGRNLIEPYEPTPAHRLIRAIDFGYRDPFVCHWLVVTPDGGLDVWKEYYQAGATMQEHAEAIRALTGDHPIWYTVADSSEPQMIADLRRYGVPALEAVRDRRAGRLAMGDALRAGRLRYMKGRAPEAIRELAFYRWAPDADREGAKEKTVGDDHAMDVDRYAVMSRPQPKAPAWRVPVGSFAWELAQRRKARARHGYPTLIGVA